MWYGWEKSLIIFPIIGLGLIYNAYKSGDGVYEVCVCNFAPTVNAIMRVNNIAKFASHSSVWSIWG